MDAINLIHRYNEGRIEIDNTGIFVCLDKDDEKHPNHFTDWMFGKGVVLRGGIELGKTYIYAYSYDINPPSGFNKDDNVSMLISLNDGFFVFVYEIEDV